MPQSSMWHVLTSPKWCIQEVSAKNTCGSSHSSTKSTSESDLASPLACDPTSATAAMVGWCAAQSVTRSKKSETGGDTARLSLPLRLTASADNNCDDGGDGPQAQQTPRSPIFGRSLVPENCRSRGSCADIHGLWLPVLLPGEIGFPPRVLASAHRPRGH